MSGVRMRPISSTSRKPRVVSSPVFAPAFCRMVFEATVVPCTTSVDRFGRQADFAQQPHHALDHRAARIAGRGGHLADVQRAVGQRQHDVGERAADVAADAHTRGARRPPLVRKHGRAHRGNADKRRAGRNCGKADIPGGNLIGRTG